MDIKELENWLWDIASILRGPVEAYNYKDYILLLRGCQLFRFMIV